MEDSVNKTGLLKTLAERSKAETPKFFKKLRIVGLALAAAGGILVAAPIALPAAVISLGSYLIVAGSVAAAVSKVTMKKDEGEPDTTA